MADLLYDQISWALSQSPVLAASGAVVAACALGWCLAPSKQWLFIGAVAAPYGVIAAIFLR